MSKGLLYIHGKNGSPTEAEHYRELFPGYEVVGLDYAAETPWEAQAEFSRKFDLFKARHDHVEVAANSIGAYFAMHSLSEKTIEKAYFISPIVDMEKLIGYMMTMAGVSEAQLIEKGRIETSFGETLSWEYLSWVRDHPVSWTIPTAILCGDNDLLQPLQSIRDLADRIGAELTVMEGGEHWFHTKEQMAFLDSWITK